MRRLILFACSVLLLTASCGYHSPYATNSNAEPISLHRSMWKNQTTELGLETVLYHTLSDWLRKSKLINLKEADEVAQYQLTGTITGIDYPEISFGENNVATELRITLTVQYQIIDSTTGKIVSQATKNFIESFFQGATPSKSQTNKNIALAEIADNISEEIYLKFITKILRK